MSETPALKEKILALEEKYRDVPKVRHEPQFQPLVRSTAAMAPFSSAFRLQTRRSVRCVSSHTLQVREPHQDIGCWWTLYDYGLEAVKSWTKEYQHPYPGRPQP